MTSKRNLSSEQIRDSFLNFFVKKKHLLHPSSSLIPANDPTLLLTNSGMAQFKSYFSGEAKPPKPRIVTSQKCFRSTDIDEVGDKTHLTLFEMLGNFSFGDYFKKEACKWGLELLTNEFELDEDRIFVTVHSEDKEAREIWLSLGMPNHKIFSFNDNWWGPAGLEGPCGPCSELHYYTGELLPKDYKSAAQDKSWGPNVSEEFLELYNLVFTQFYHQLDGVKKELPQKNIDTGLGLERLTSVLQEVDNCYDTDLFREIIKKIEELSGIKWKKSKISDKAIIIIAEHVRSATFLIGDGVIPENTGRGYILRRIIRRAMRYGMTLNMKTPFMGIIAEEVMKKMGVHYPELTDNKPFILKVLEVEETKFSSTLHQGNSILKILLENRKLIQQEFKKLDIKLEKMISRNKINSKDFIKEFENSKIGPESIISNLLSKAIDLEMHISDRKEPQLKKVIQNIRKTNWGNTISGYEVAYLYDTLGFPLEVTSEIASEVNIKVDTDEFNNIMDKLKKRAKLSSQFKDDLSSQRLFEEMGISETIFQGHQFLTTESMVLGIIDNGKPTEEVIEGNEIEIILDQTPFYPEGGGQVGDQGKFSSENSSIIEISDTQSPSSGIIVHQGKVSQGSIKVGDTVTAKVDISQREKSKRNHTGTHILHAALREILGKHVRQQGSLVAPERLRFDFTHLKKLTQKEIEEVQNLVNGKIRLNLPVHKHITSYNEAIESGALAFFGDKYDHEVRTVEISNGSKFSYELCGGTHCSFTGEIGAFYIISESSIASGVRRIEAVTGVNAENFVTKNFSILNKISSNLNVPTSELETKIDGITKEVENFKKELNNLQSKIYSINTQEFTKNSETIGKTTIVATLLDVPNQELLRQMGDNIRSQVDSGAICLASEIQGKASIIIMITKDISDKLNAKQLIQEISPIIQGGGGGRPELAQAGGIKPEKLPEAIKLFRKIVKTILSEN